MKHWISGEFGLSLNPSITPEFIDKNRGKSFHWGSCGLSLNRSITPEFVEQNHTKFGTDGWDYL
jgi:hypothetical protein